MLWYRNQIQDTLHTLTTVEFPRDNLWGVIQYLKIGIETIGGVGLTSDSWRQTHVRSDVSRRQWSLGTVHVYRTPGGMESQNRHDRHPVSRFYRKVIHQKIQEECKTKDTRDERTEKLVREISLRGPHLKVVYYNGKQVLLWIHHPSCRCTLFGVLTTFRVPDKYSFLNDNKSHNSECRCDERLKRERWDIYTPHLHSVVWGTGTPKLHPKIETRLTGERFPRTIGECVT